MRRKMGLPDACWSQWHRTDIPANEGEEQQREGSSGGRLADAQVHSHTAPSRGRGAFSAGSAN